MPIDILIFAVIAALIIHRLRSVLGTRNGAEKERPNPFADNAEPKTARVVELKPADYKRVPENTFSVEQVQTLVRDKAGSEGDVVKGLTDIAKADNSFNTATFMTGARYAFPMIVTAFYTGERETLKNILSPKLFADFSQGIAAREQRGEKADIKIHAITDAKIIEARLLGVMAYITVDFDVEETVTVKNATGAIVDGAPDSVTKVHDVWVFARDIRSNDPNWMLIETRSQEN